MKILFLGRDGCDYSQQIFGILQNVSSEVTYVGVSDRGQTIPTSIRKWSGDYIFAFRSFYILPEEVLGAARIAAINFHPGPPEYPGSGCVNFALYEGSPEFGVTAHLMVAKIDSGPILRVARFPVVDSDNLINLLPKVHSALYLLAKEVIDYIFTSGEDSPIQKMQISCMEKWTGKKRKISDLNKLQIVDRNIKKSELEKVIRSTHLTDYPVKIKLYGREFYLDIKS